ncbi:hypothetical protein GRI58_12505 [Porphyrobacter algicida]|uniref:Uncharacterized protein n=1 Tax=Qipengyuania algicida TaxID=1836209 RepID=A0A845AJP7_9SPHN|nr:hypothetical protein [Qipengyuania algicida]MXP29637.1 hypothetical protein [Qipengyuania algicida]
MLETFSSFDAERSDREAGLVIEKERSVGMAKKTGRFGCNDGSRCVGDVVSVNAARDSASKATLSQYRLSTDTLSRVIAATHDAKAHCVPMHSDFSPATQSASIASLTLRVKGMPQVPALLAKHGLSPFAYVVATLAEMQNAMAAQMHGSPLVAKIVGAPNDANKAFYAQLEAAIRKLMALSQ